MKQCQTPGSVYNTRIKGSSVSVAVDLPFSLDLTEDQAKRLENELHDALEEVLKQFFKSA